MFDFMNDEPLPPAPKRSSLTAALMEEANPEPLQPTFSEEPSVPTSTVTTTAASSATANSPEPPSTPNFNKRPTYSATRPSMFDMKPRFVINFISACDIPAADFRSKCDPYLRAFISKHDDNEVDSEGRKVFRLKRISNYVCTPKKLDCKSAVWNCYRDFRLIPPEGSILTVEMYHTTSDSTKPDNLLGKVDIAIASLNDETSKTFYLVNFKTNREKNPKFSVTLQRAWIDEAPPKRKTFFLIRHGQSKWNEAQSKINIPGLLDRDHPLTEMGINQASDLNKRWKEYLLFHKASGLIASQATSPKKRTPEKEPNNATGKLLSGYDDEDDESTKPPTADSSSAMKAADLSNDIWNDNFARSQILDFTSSLNFDDDDDDLQANSIDSDDSDEEGATDDAALWKEKSLQSEAQLSRDTEHLIKEFHQAEINITEKITGNVNEEAVDERRDGYIKLFMHVDKVYSSPLTRALETALLSMEGHRAMTNNGLVLYSVIREVKRIGGLDTVGVECGDGIERRVRSELGAVLGPKRADEMLSIPIDINDTDQPWWTPMSSHESEREQQDRVNEFLNYSRYCDAKIPVFVGHSLFFRAFYSKRVSSQLFQNRRHLSEQLKRFRLSNASMLAVTVAYQEKEGGYSDAVMIDADLIFGGGFHGATKDHDGGHAHDNSSILAQLSTSPGANTVFSNLNIPGFAANISQDLKQKKDQLSKGVKMFSEKIYDIFEK